ncbi:MAG: hypothetical protein A2927_00455 [Candidatus Komeilibacteria bacterium RIFCSPLOWO2_01_FULL_45_10]|uniref:Nucleotidyl transferase AbiEii toxin, Type IV TA system n=1 Tax=Candidatus Komeilibacteria bacterium RIFCSPLOWO2_01_FULL_45_10 TaxID=1798550 RepID=A0A1G2BJE6_9BACT|nr:MAG: hypothetical protein A2927_00455 [Candidatus Komeilibacteria bacterium RIFCSPLOWO2_01_FULL_45_10]
MFKESINQKTRLVLEKISQSDLVERFYLAGGTALAIALKHRESIDLDWFFQADFSNQEIKAQLSQLGVFQVIGESEGTVNGLLDNVRVSFLRYQYKLLFPLVAIAKVKLADERDIAAMKIDAISSRGSKKDFIDIFFLLKKYSLAEMIGFFEKKYSRINYNKLHLLKSLVYFADADNEPMPVMIRIIDWEKVKRDIQIKVNAWLKS